MNDKLQFNENFQRAIVTFACTKDKWLSEHRPFIEAEYIEDPHLATLLGCVLEFYDKHDIPPEYDVLEEVIREKHKPDVAKAVIRELSSVRKLVPSLSLERYLSDGLIQFGTTQRYRRAVIQAANDLELGRLDNVRSTFDEAAGFTSKAFDEGILFFDPDSIDGRIGVNPDESPNERILTLFPTMDDKLRGGASRGELLVFMAPPSRGKSMGLVNIGSTALFTGANVVHVTVEMSAKKTAIRYDMRLSGMTYDQIVRNEQAFQKKLKAFRKLYKGDLIVKGFPSRSVSPADVEGYIKTLIRRRNFTPDIVVIDYADELKRPRRDNEAYALGDVYSGLRAMAARLDCAVWTATQTTRAGFSKNKLDMDDVADSWDKIKVSDVVVGMCQTEDEKKSDVMRWYFVKNRDNPPYWKPIFMRTKFETATFKELNDGEEK